MTGIIKTDQLQGAQSSTITVPSGNNLTVGGTLGVTGVLTATSLDISGDIDVDGTTNLDVVDIDGALTQDGGAVFNEASADVDFRVESNDQANMFFVDGGNNRVGLGITPSFNVQIDKSSTNTTLTDLTDAQLILSNTGSATTNQHVKLGFRFQDGSLNGQAMITAVREANNARRTALTLSTAPSDGDPDERMRISSAGNVGIGNTNPEAFGSLIDNLVIGTTSGNNGITIVSGTSDGGRICFADNTASPQRGMIEYAHSLDAMLLNINGSTRVKIHSNGVTSFNAGIALGVGLNNTASNVLDDYEEGTFTPGLIDSGGGLSASLSVAIGQYTKVGNLVNITLSITIASRTSTNNQVYITNLPFTSSYSSTAGRVELPVSGSYINFDTGYSFITARITHNETAITLLMNGDSVSQENFRGHDIGGSTSLFVSGAYYT